MNYGRSYKGLFSDGMFNGIGILTFHDYSQYTGPFEQGKMDGEGVIKRYVPGGTVEIEAIYNEGSLIGP